MTNSEIKNINKVQQYANAYPENSVIDNPRYAEVWVRQKGGSFVERVSVLPELPSDHPVRNNMERWGFQLVARVYADSVKVITYKGFYRTKDSKAAEGQEPKANGTICAQIFGEDILQEDGEAMLLNMFLFKGFQTVTARDQDGHIIKNQDGKAEMVNVGVVNSVQFYDIANKEQTDRMLAYKSCCMPSTIIVKGLQKIDILKSNKGGMFTVKGEFLYAKKMQMPEHTASSTPAKVEPTYGAEDSKGIADVAFEPVMSNLDHSASDDLPF